MCESDLIEPCAVEIVTSVLGEQSTEKLAAVQLSNNVAADRLLSWLKSMFAFSLQRAEPTDMSSCQQYLCLYRSVPE
jgi:hypothetical protein